MKKNRLANDNLNSLIYPILRFSSKTLSSLSDSCRFKGYLFLFGGSDPEMRSIAWSYFQCGGSWSNDFCAKNILELAEVCWSFQLDERF